MAVYFTDTHSFSSGSLIGYANIAALSAAVGHTDRSVAYVVDTDTFYEYVAASGAGLVANYVAVTAEGGNTRWIAVAGQYNTRGISISNMGADAYSLPSTDGAVDQALVTDGTGTLTWTTVSECIANPTTYYVDGTAGDDTNDGLTWGTAKRTMQFLRSTGTGAIPRQINADITINVRNTVYSVGTDYHTLIDGFYGSDVTMSITGETTDVATGLAATVWDNVAASVTYHSYVEAGAAVLVPNAHRGQFIIITAGTGAGATLYPIMSNTVTRLETTNLPDLSGTSVFKIVSCTSFRGATVAAPGVLVAYTSGSAILRSNSEIAINFSQIDFTDFSDYNVFEVRKSDGCIDNFISVNHIVEVDSRYNFKRSYANLITDAFMRSVNYFHRGEFFIKHSVIESTTGGGWGILARSGANLSIETSRIGNQARAISASGLQSDIFIMDTYIHDCTVGIQGNGSTIDLVYYINIASCDIAIDSSGCKIMSYTDTVVQGAGNTIEVQLSDVVGDVDTFANINAQATMHNLSTGFVVDYYDNVTYLPIQNPEYDPTASGLGVYNYQAAIDALAIGGGTLQSAYVGGNTIAATAAEGTISFSVADNQNIPVLALTQSDVTNNPAALTIANAGTGHSIQIDTSAFVITGAGKYAGFGIAAPNTEMHIHSTGVAGAHIQITDATTGSTATDGCLIGMNADESISIWNYENTPLYFGTNNARVFTFTTAGHGSLGTGEGGVTIATGNMLRAPDITTGGAGDIDGADIYFSAGLGTGTGDVGQLIFQTPRVAAAGDNIQTRTTLVTMDAAVMTVSGDLTTDSLTLANTGSITDAVNLDVDTGTETVDTFADTLGDGCVWFYVVKKGVNSRTGTVMATWEATGNTASYTEASTTDEGDTSPLTLAVDIAADNVRLRATATTDDWEVRVIRFLIS